MKHALALIAAFLVLAAPAGAKPVEVTVMTRNLDLGVDLVPLATADPGQQFEDTAANVFKTARDTNFPVRARAIAREIAKAKPDVVGFQETSWWYTGPKNQPPATNLAFEHLKPLVSELKRLHAPYSVHLGGGGTDIEGPTSLGFDIRLREDESVMLVRKGVKVAKRQAHPFKDLLKIPTKAVGTVTVTRSWQSLDLVKAGVRFRVVDTHLEAYSEDIRTAQAKELLAGPLRSKTPVILVGDLNSRPGLDPGAYDAITKAGFAVRRTPTFNCCYGDAKSPFKWDHNVDWIMARPNTVKLVRSYITGKAKLPEGVYPSDHGGVVSTLKVS